jgi:hypothetical protein
MNKLTAATLLGFLVSAAAWSQTAGLGTISGTVHDASGSAIPGAKVVVSNTALGLTREILTTDAGLFVAPALTPAGGYKVNITKDGFAAYEAADLRLQVGETVNLTVSLAVGVVTQSVDVTAAAPIVEDTKTDLSAVVDNAMITDLPINGRRVDQFVQFAPAVTKDADFGLLTFRGMAGGNNFLLDGNDTTNQYYNENAGRTRLGSQLSQDAVQEFQVLTGTYSAEFGRANGGVVNTITKSGTNNIHGTFFWFFRNRTLNAIDRYAIVNNAPYDPPEVRHQTGGSVGGPLVKNKLFGFFSTEIQRRHFPMADFLINNNVNSATQSWNGCVVGGATGATAAQCAAINAVLPRLFGSVDRNGNQQLYFLKFDYRPNDRNSLSASINYLKWFSVNGIQTGLVSTSGAAAGSNGDDSVRDRMGKLQWTYVPSGTVINEARFGWFKDRQADDFDPALQAGYPIGNVSLSVAGISTLGGYNILPRINPSENRFQYVDNLSWIKGSHNMKFGIDIARTEDFSNSLSNRFGSYTYANVTAFAQDFTNPAPGPSHYQSYAQAFGNPIVDTYITDLGFYAQDAWKITPKLTFNYGLRYEYSVLPQPTVTNPNYSQTAHIPSAGRNFAPRAGIAYALDSKTVFRAGYGLYYSRYVSGLINTFFTGNGIYTTSLSLQSPTLAGAPVFPNVLTTPGAAATGSTTLTFAAPDMRNPYTEQWTAGIERALTNKTSLTVSYIGNRGKRLYTVRDINIGPLSTTPYTFTFLDKNYNPTGQTYTTPIYLLANRIDTRYGHINQVENGGKQWYDAMAVQFNQRFNGTFQAAASYTWSHEIDENQESGSSAIFFSGGPMGLYNGAYSLDKGNGNLDQRHKFTGTLIVKPTLWHSNNALAKYVVNGWELDGIVTFASGRPNFESASWGSTTNVSNLEPFTGTINGLGGDNRVPWLPNNPLMIDGVTRADARISKNFTIHERMNLTLLFEAFNVSNTISNTGVMSQGFTAANIAASATAAPMFVVAPCSNVTAANVATKVCSSTTPGFGTASAGFPDGTNARRAQVGLRFAF